MIKIENVTKYFDDKLILDKISFTILDGGRVILYGNSGQGKTTLLKMIAGLDTPTSGDVFVDDDSISFAMQNNLLLENISAYDNIAYGIDHRLFSKQELQTKVVEISDFFECKDFLYQLTNTLSGGQKQRVALARAFIKKPSLVLMDESFNSLDLELKESLLTKILDKQKKDRFTFIYVTHDRQDVKLIDGRIIYLEDGKMKAKEI